MKTRFLLLLAAMLLGTASAFAQSGTPLKGDVNEDGVVDFADINAVIAIMKNGGGTSEETKYYWYAGQTAPTSTSTVTTATSYDNGGGWFELGTTIPNTIRELVKGGNSELNWYAAVPITNGSTLKPVAGDMTTIDTSVKEYSTITINNISYQVYYYGGFTAARNTFAFAKFDNLNPPTPQTTYYWYVGHENPMNMTSITPLNSNDASAGAGWRTIGTTLPTYTKNNPLWDNNMYGTISTASSKSTQYMALPSNNIKSRNDITGEDITSDGWNTIGTKTLNGVTYTIYSSVNTKKSFMDTLY